MYLDLPRPHSGPHVGQFGVHGFFLPQLPFSGVSANVSMSLMAAAWLKTAATEE